MNNLKRILSLALASVMLVGMMVVGASATSYPDDEKIVNKEAVEILGALGIMNGDDRGFRPEDGLKRCEAAKMLAKLHNKGRDVTYGSKTTPTFKDIKGHWAEDNIEYAAAFGIVNGYDDGTFKPETSLTVVQLVRMTLNMMGYEEGKTGRDWELQTTVLADNIGLFAGLDTFDPSAPVTRDQAAQILVNSINAPMAGDATYTETVTKNLETGKYLINQVEGGKDMTAVTGQAYGSFMEAYLVATNTIEDSAYVTDFTITAEKKPGDVKETKEETLAHKYMNVSTSAPTNSDANVLTSVKLVTSGTNKGTYNVTVGGVDYTKVKTDYSALMGQSVQVLYKGGKTDSVYGIVAQGAVLTTGVYGDIVTAANGSKSMNGVAFDTTVAESYFNNSATVNTPAANATVKAIDNNGNGKVDALVITPVKDAAVTNVTATTIVVNKGIGSKATDNEIKGYEGIAKGDKVAVIEAAYTVSGMIELTKAETLEGVAIDAARAATQEIRVNGTWYPVLGTTNFNTLAAMTANSTYDLVIINGYVVSQAAAVTAASTDLLILTAVAQNATGLNDYKEARAYFVADGTTQIIKLSTANTVVATEKTLLTYKVNDKGYYETAALDDTKLGYDNKGANATVTWATNSATAKIDGKLIADDAKILVLYNKGDKGLVVETVDAKTARTWENTNNGFANFGNTGASFSNNVNGVPYVKFAFINAESTTALPGQTGATGHYGYVVSDPYLTTSNGTKYSTYELWNGTETITVLDKCQTALDKGDFVEYADLGNGVIDTTKQGERALGTAAAVTGLSAADKVIYLLNAQGPVNNGNALTLDDQTKTFFVDSKNSLGMATGTLELAAIADGAYTPNVKYVLNDTDTTRVDILIVDVSNAMAGEGTIATAASIKALDDGVYVSGIKYLPDMGDFNQNGKNVFFKFTGVANEAKTYTLTIKLGDKDAYVETASFSDTNGHFFVINTAATGDGSGGSRKNISDCYTVTEGTYKMKAGTYSVTITVTGGTEPILNSTFTVK